MPVDPAAIREMARRYTEAWCSHDPEKVASFYEEDGRITINDGEPMIGRPAIADMARGFHGQFPNLVVAMDDVRTAGSNAVYLWTPEGSDSVSGNRVRVSGWEAWGLSDAGLVSRSEGRFDASAYERQLTGGA